MISALPLVTVYDNLLTASVLNHCSADACIGNVASYLELIITDGKYIIKGNGLSGICTKLFNLDDIAFGYLILLTARF